MKSLSTVGLCLSLVFGCLFLALIAELYYLLWWKKRFNNGGSIENGYKNSSTKEFLCYTFCCKTPSSSTSRSTLNSSEALVLEPGEQNHTSSDKEMWYNTFGEDNNDLDAELMRLQSMAGPPRFLFTIKEETKEDLESEDGKSRKGSRSRSLSDFFHTTTVETPYLTPLASPPYYTPPLTPIRSSQNQSFFELTNDAEFNRLRSSPPPTFQFLKDAEDKLYRSKFEENDEKDFHEDDEDGSFISIIVGNNKENELQCPSSSQVLPLANSPPKSFRT